MFTNYSASNRVVSSALQVNYSVERRKDGDTYWYKVTRKATKNYRYVDLTESSAENVQAIMMMKYTRDTRKCISRTLDKTFESITSDITTQRNNNGSYDVIVNVNECDSTHSATVPADPSSLFTTENARDYGEGESGINVVSVDLNPTMNTLRINLSVSGDLIGTNPTSIQLFSGDSLVEMTFTQTSTNGYYGYSGYWGDRERYGIVKIGSVETEWSLD